MVKTSKSDYTGDTEDNTSIKKKTRSKKGGSNNASKEKESAASGKKSSKKYMDSGNNDNCVERRVSNRRKEDNQYSSYGSSKGDNYESDYDYYPSQISREREGGQYGSESSYASRGEYRGRYGEYNQGDFRRHPSRNYNNEGNYGTFSGPGGGGYYQPARNPSNDWYENSPEYERKVGEERYRDKNEQSRRYSRRSDY